jgi:integrase
MQFFNKPEPTTHVPWNKGKLIGQKPPLRPKHVWAIRTQLQLAKRRRDLALFNLAIDSKLRGCDVVSLKVEDIAPHGYAVERATVRQRKTGRPVKFEITEHTRQAVDDYLRTQDKKPVFLKAVDYRALRNNSRRQLFETEVGICRGETLSDAALPMTQEFIQLGADDRVTVQLANLLRIFIHSPPPY